VKEVVTWKALRHPNIMPLLGATMTETRFTMVSEWMVKGDINKFVKANADADRLRACVFFVQGPRLHLSLDDNMVAVAERGY
jgi:hypothetical protein